MNRPKQQNGLSPVWYIAIAPVLLAAFIAFYFLWPSKVELSPDTYEIAVALYRVCNQQDENGLEQIQSKLTQLSDSSSSKDPSIAHLQRIVHEAQRENWKDAMRFAHEVLDQSSGA